MAETGIIALIVATIVGAGAVIRCRSARGSRRANVHRHSTAGSNTPKTRAGQLVKLRDAGNFWGISIRSGACRASLRLLGNKYGLDDAPQLPLPDCDAQRCTCQFIALRDLRAEARRSGHERREEIRFDPDHPDRRSHRDRRRKGDIWKNRAD